MTAPHSDKDSVHVRVPATTANLGPGFDCMGMAVDLWNELIVTKSNTFEMTIEGMSSRELLAIRWQRT